MKTPRVCAACGKDLYRKKVWEKWGSQVIGYCCATTHTFTRAGCVRRRVEDAEPGWRERQKK